MTENRYIKLIEHIFQRNYKEGAVQVSFRRTELEEAAEQLNIKLPKNLGDIIYSFRYRSTLPTSITQTAPEGKEWVIVGEGKSQYRFELSIQSHILPSPHLLAVKIPDATPQIIVMQKALGDEQALLAKVRYNRLVDTFLSLTTYSLQNHLRTTVKGIGQIEIDELYVGVNSRGAQFIIPVQAKVGTDKIGVSQTLQDLAYCARKYPLLKARSVSAQFMGDDIIALFELVIDENDIKVVSEMHYRLVPGDNISEDDLNRYSE